MKKIISISLAILLLTSNMGFSIGTHYCGGHAVKVQLMFRGGDLDCGMSQMPETDCENETSNNSFQNDNCCGNEYQLINLEEDFHSEKTELNFKPTFDIYYAPVFSNKKNKVNFQKLFFSHYDPPPLEQDIHVLLQTFLL